MSEPNENKNNDPNDPFDFFKLSVDQDDKDDKNKKPKKPKPFPIFTLIFLGIAVFLLFSTIRNSRNSENLIDFSKFREMIETNEIDTVILSDSYFIGYKESGTDTAEKEKGFSLFSFATSNTKEYRTVGILTDEFIDFLNQKGITYSYQARQSGIWIQILISLLPIAILVGLYVFMFRKMGGGMSGMGSLFGNGGGKSKAVDEGKVKTRFADVAGVDEAKEELVEVVDFLKQPKKYTEIGGKIPKGVLLVGPPGTGKTLLARAVAGEAGVPFFRISGSDFVEMFVGVGASRVRDLFRTAREKAPCIIFIDELDAIGKSRVNNLGGNDEREQTLNQLLVEMDGFDNEKGLIVLAATNRPDILDPALLRPGRFDRQVPVERPDVKGREAILRIHSKNVKLDPDVDFESLAHGTIGFAGADLANMVNEAALLAVRNGRKLVSMEDFNDAIDKVSIGLKKKTRRENEKERKTVAYHETGHALVGAFTPDYPPVNKITVVPRSHGVGGFTQYREEEEKNLQTKRDLLNEVDVLLGGRAAEQVIFGEISTGAANDISRATGILKSMITDYGMSDKFLNMTLGKSGKGYGGPQEPELVREFSEETQRYIDEEIARIMQERYKHVLKLLKDHKQLLEYIGNNLLEKETMDGKEFAEIVKAEIHCKEIASDSSSSASTAEIKVETPETPKKRGRKPKED